jgi:hypothetical protein
MELLTAMRVDTEVSRRTGEAAEEAVKAVPTFRDRSDTLLKEAISVIPLLVVYCPVPRFLLQVYLVLTHPTVVWAYLIWEAEAVEAAVVVVAVAVAVLLVVVTTTTKEDSIILNPIVNPRSCSHRKCRKSSLICKWVCRKVCRTLRARAWATSTTKPTLLAFRQARKERYPKVVWSSINKANQRKAKCRNNNCRLNCSRLRPVRRRRCSCFNSNTSRLNPEPFPVKKVDAWAVAVCVCSISTPR